MKTLWQHFLDFIQPLIDPLAHDDKVKRKHPLTDDVPKKMERFTQRARRVLGLAQIAAEDLQHDHIGPEHVLLGLIREVDGIAGSLLKELKVDLKQAEALVVSLSNAGKRKIGVNLELLETTKKLLELSVDEARQMGHYYIGTEHLLLGLVRQNNTIAIQMLTGLGVTPAEVRQHMKRALQDMHPQTQEDVAEDRNLEHLTPLMRGILITAMKEAERLVPQIAECEG